MTRRNALIAAAVVFVSVVAIFIGWWFGRKDQGPTEAGQADTPRAEILDGETLTAALYFPGPRGQLFTEERELPVQSEFLDQLRAILDEILVGPESEDLFPALPPDISVEWLHVSPSGVLYVDLKFTGEASHPAWGSRQEMLAVYSVVNTLLANAPEIDSVVLLRNGQQRPTFAGHLDTSRPLLANQQILATQ